MKRTAAILLVSAWAVTALWGCAPAPYFPDTQSGSPYISPLKPAKSQRVLGRYPGHPDEDGIMTVRAVGKGIPPENARSKAQAVLLAERAAVMDGYRNLAEKIHGLYLQAYSGMGNYSVSSDIIRAEVETWLRGAEVTDLHYGPDGLVEATMTMLVHVSPDHVLYRSIFAQEPRPQP